MSSSQLGRRFAGELSTAQVAGNRAQPGEVCGVGSIVGWERRAWHPTGDAGVLHPGQCPHRLVLDGGQARCKAHDGTGLGDDGGACVSRSQQVAGRLQCVERLAQLTTSAGQIASFQPHGCCGVLTGQWGLHEPRAPCQPHGEAGLLLRPIELARLRCSDRCEASRVQLATKVAGGQEGPGERLQTVDVVAVEPAALVS